ncbi:MAG: MFS transporter, partial [Thermoplasmataceae archaeon]
MRTSNSVKMPWVNILSSWSGWLIDGFITLTYVLTIVSFKDIRGIFFPNSAFLGLGFLFSTLGFALAGGISRFLGSAIMGNYIGDKIGRRTMLIISVPIFSFANFLIFFVPGFDSIGYFSAFLLYLIAFIVGFFAGAEYGGGTALSLESVPAEKRLWVGAFVQSGFGMGFVLIALVLYFLANATGGFAAGSAFTTYDFRYLFLISVIPGAISLIFRYFSTETKVFSEVLEKNETDKVPIFSMLSSKGRKSVSEFLILVVIIGGLLTVNSATFGYYMIVLLHANFAFGFAQYDFIYIMIINVISIVGVFFGAFISTRLILRQKSLVLLSIVFLLISYIVVILAGSSSPYV